MPTQLVPDTAQVRFIFDGDLSTQMGGAHAEFSLYVRDEVAPGWSQTNLDLLRDYAEDWHLAEFVPLQDADWALTQIHVKDIGAALGGESFYNPASPVHGSRTGEVSSPASAVLYRFRGDVGGAPKKGFIFLPVGVDADLVGQFWSTAFLTSVNDAMDAWFSGLSGQRASWAGVIVSRFLSTNDDVKNARQALREAIEATRRATAVTNTLATRSARALVGSQRDRRAG